MNISIIDIVGFLAAALVVVGYLPQTIKVIKTRSTDDISLMSFVIIAIGSILFMVQGFATKNYYLGIANTCTGIMSLIIFSIKIYNDRRKHSNHSVNNATTTDSGIVFAPDGISDEYVMSSGLGFDYITAESIKPLLKARDERANKGTYGHALLICGSKGMIGAATLATGGALRSGCGLVTAHIPECERFAVASNYPSSILSLDNGDCFSKMPNGMERYNAIGIGCGVGQKPESVVALNEVLAYCTEHKVSVVLDADALNMIAKTQAAIEAIPASAILTPHAAELERLVGAWDNEEEKLNKVLALAKNLNCVIVVKGPNTLICDKGISISSNSTGNAGMAKGGSGDVLTGLLTGLLARGYSPEDAAKIGVYIHGLAGDKAADYWGQEGMNSSDLIDFLGEAMAEIQ